MINIFLILVMILNVYSIFFLLKMWAKDSSDKEIEELERIFKEGERKEKEMREKY